MKIHSDVITRDDVYRAASVARSVFPGTSVEVSAVGSRSHRRAFEVHMTGDGSTCRNRTNAGTRYGDHGTEAEYSAGYAAWGWLVATLYDIDPDAVWGSAKNPIYGSKADFELKTADLFDTDLSNDERRAATLDFQKNGPRKMAKRQADRVEAFYVEAKQGFMGTPGRTGI